MLWKPVFNLSKNINWEYLSLNEKAIHILENNLDKINWGWLSGNPSAIELLKANPDKIDWRELSQNYCKLTEDDV